ncbi:hypothetical protein FNV43_RR12532 [Rhamnella rubrinervis]|uniref:Uncharacterized protein n=1 Tax=Rhamnella rubrinervis TaxID=2594499 RepID=A0A8K0H7H3_9ROSA|nr:hypothetical protein FNV43_RR12532 [Rhamnella rubrinervis]
MAPLKRLRKASDKSTEATTVTEAAATKKRSREVEESSNALQTANLGYSSAKVTEASVKLARSPLVISDTPGQICGNGEGALYYIRIPPAKVRCIEIGRVSIISRIPPANLAMPQSWRGIRIYEGLPATNLAMPLAGYPYIIGGTGQFGDGKLDVALPHLH